MQRFGISNIALLVAMLAGAGAVSANTVVTDGHEDFFTSGEQVGSGTFLNTKQADGTVLSAPFDGNFIGADTAANANFSASWTFNYAAITSTITSGSFTLGILDSDASAPGDQVATFTLGGVNLTAALNTVFNASGGLSGHYDIYTLSLPSTALLALATGTAEVSLLLQNGAGLFGATPSNGAALDFSTLSLSTQPVINPVPAPATVLLLLGGFSAMLAGRRNPV